MFCCRGDPKGVAKKTGGPLWREGFPRGATRCGRPPAGAEFFPSTAGSPSAGCSSAAKTGLARSLTSARPALIVSGGAGPVPENERELRQAAVERARDAGWAEIGRGALAAAVAAVRLREDEPLLNAGIGACLNADGVVELDAGVMEGAEVPGGGVAWGE